MCQVVLGFRVRGTLQDPFKDRCRGGDDDRAEGNEDAHEDAACTIIALGEHDNEFSYRDKTKNGERAKPDGPQSAEGLQRECVVLSDISQHLEGLVEPRKKWNGRYICIRQKWILEIDLEEGGVRVSAFEMRLPKQEGKSDHRQEPNDRLEKSGRENE